MQDQWLKAARRYAEERRVVIDEVNMATGYISAHDRVNSVYQISMDSWSPPVVVPSIGEAWIVAQRGTSWYLIRKFETGEETVPLASLDPGDVRVEAKNNLHLNGATVIINGEPLVMSPSMPSGSIIMYGGTAAPTDYVLCDGASYPRTGGIYDSLFTAIGIRYGAVDGSHFSVPDMQGRFPVGYAPTGHADVALLGNNDGAVIGSRRPRHSHGLGNIAIAASGSHTHTFTGSSVTSGAGTAHSHGATGLTFTGTGGTTAGQSVNHTHSGTTGTVSADHAHQWTGYRSNGAFDGSLPGNNSDEDTWATQTTGGITANHTHAFTTGNTSVDHTHTFTPAGTMGGNTANESTHTHSVTAAGTNSSTTHVHATGDFTGSVGTTATAPSESPSYLVVNYIIKL